ncbi:unnamed protein product, partial [marine sediment metagenome]
DDLQGSAKEDLAELDARAVESLESGTCPTCGQPLDWSKVMPISVLKGMEKRSLGAGYWELPPVRPPPGWESVKLLRKAGYDGPIRVESVVDLTTGEILL